jgi:hypothetical protein
MAGDHAIADGSGADSGLDQPQSGALGRRSNATAQFDSGRPEWTHVEQVVVAVVPLVMVISPGDWASSTEWPSMAEPRRGARPRGEWWPRTAGPASDTGAAAAVRFPSHAEVGAVSLVLDRRIAGQLEADPSSPPAGSHDRAAAVANAVSARRSSPSPARRRGHSGCARRREDRVCCTRSREGRRQDGGLRGA